MGAADATIFSGALGNRNTFMNIYALSDPSDVKTRVYLDSGSPEYVYGAENCAFGNSNGGTFLAFTSKYTGRNFSIFLYYPSIAIKNDHGGLEKLVEFKL